MQTFMFVLGQVLGLAAALVGLHMLCGLAWTLIAGGLLLAGGATALEAVSAPSRGRQRGNAEGGR